MTLNRLVAASFAVALALTLGSCSQFSDAVSDNWPHFAGGEPAGLPPRPGSPGYAQFIAHGQANEAANAPAPSAQPQPGNGGTGANSGQQLAGTPRQSATFAVPPPAAQVSRAPSAPADDRDGNDAGVVQGGLY